MKSSIAFIITAIALCSMLLLADNLDNAYALSVTFYNNGTSPTDASYIIRCAGVIITGDGTTLKFFSATTPSTQLGTLTLGGNAIGCSGSRAYNFVVSSGVLSEVDITNMAVLRTLSTGCTTTAIFFDTNNFYCEGSTDTVKRIAYGSMSITYTSSTLNTGASACTGVTGITYESSSDTIFATCVTNDRIVAVNGFSSSGTPDYFIAGAIATERGLVYNPDNDNLLVCGDTTSMLLNNTGSALATWVTFGSIADCITGHSTLRYSTQQNWFIATSEDDDNVTFFDAGAGTTIISVDITDNTDTGYVFFHDLQHIYGDTDSTTFFVLDSTGIPAGSGGSTTPPPSGTNQINGVCGNTDVNGDGRVNVIDCVGSNQTAWGGFTSNVPAVQVVGSITDGLGITDCAEDGSDQETCGSGLFFFIIVLLLVEFLALAGYLGLTSKLGGTREVVDVLLIMLIAGFAVVALSFYLDWIPDLVFYTIIALIAGFLTFGIVSKLRGK